MLDTHLTDKVTNMVLSMNVMNTMNRACGQQGSFKENRKIDTPYYKETCTLNKT